MRTFKTLLRIVAAHWGNFLVYLFVLSLLGLLTGAAAGSGTTTEIRDETPTVAVVDRDGSEISVGVRTYVESTGEVRELADSAQDLQDATARGRIEYILIIPAGFGDALVDAARGQQPVPLLDTVVSFDSAAGALMDVRTNSYLDQVHDYLATVADSQGEAVALANEAMARSAQAEVVPSEVGALPGSLEVYARFATYPLLAFAVVSISTFMVSINRRPLRSRLTASPVSGLSRNLGLLATCLVIGLVGWGWIFGAGLVAFGLGSLTGAAPLLGIVALALFAYALVAVAVGFLLAQLGAGQHAATAVANIGGMAMSFLAGAWVPLDLMPSGVVALAKLTPAYWACQAVDGASTATSVSFEALSPLVADCGVCALFAVAVGAVGLMAGRTRARAAL